MAVTSWTDNDSNGVPMDWTNPNLADWRYVDALVQAVNERRSAIGQNLLIFPDYAGRYLNISILQQIHAAVIALIPQYVNHEDNSGNWNGKAAIPLWSFNSIMDSITGNVYQLNSGTHVKSETFKLWAALMYKCLNKIRWIKEEDIYYDSKTQYGRSWGYEVSGTTQQTWENAFTKTIDDLNSCELKDRKDSIHSFCYYSDQFNTSEYPNCYASYSKGNLYFTRFFSISFLAKFYSQLEVPSQYDPYATTIYKDDKILYPSGYIKDKLNLLGVSNTNKVFIDFGIPQHPSLPPFFIAGDYGHGYVYPADFTRTIGIQISCCRQAIIQFDTAGGFKFKDW